MAVTFNAAGSVAASANNVTNPTTYTVALPTRSTDDLLVCLTFCRSITATVSTPSGWTLASGFPLRSATASGGSWYLFLRVVDGSETAPSISWSGVTTGTTGDSSQAVILSYSGVDISGGASGVLDGTATKNDQAGATTTATIPSITTSLDASQWIAAVAKIIDASFTWTPPSTFTERVDSATTTGTGHSLEISDKTLASAGASGTTTAAPSNTASARALGISFALKDRGPTTIPLTLSASTKLSVGSEPRAAQISGDSPTAWWRFNEDSGASSLSDETGNGHSGTPANGVVLGVAGSQGNAVSFDGSNDQITADTLGTLGSNALTSSWEFWIKTTSTAFGTVFGTINTGTSMIVGVYLNSLAETLSVGSTEFHMRDNGGVTMRGHISTNIYDGQWHHVVWVVSSSNTFTVYVDGVSQTVTYTIQTAMSSAVNLGWPLGIGYRNNRGTAERWGAFTLDDFAVYPTRLTATQVADHYNASTESAGSSKVVSKVMAAATSLIGTISSLVTPGGGGVTNFLTLSVAAKALVGRGYAPIVLADTPLAYFKFDETSGTTAADSSGNGRNGTYGNITLGGATILAEGKAAYFDGTSYVEVPNTGLSVSSISIETWFKADPADYYGTLAYSDKWTLYMDTAISALGFEFATTPSAVWDSIRSEPWGTVVNDQWYHAVVTYDGSTVKMYLNGVEVSSKSPSTAGALSSLTRPVQFGRVSASWGDDSYFKGYLDEPAIYNYPLSAGQVAEHYAQGLAAKGLIRSVGKRVPLAAVATATIRRAVARTLTAPASAAVSAAKRLITTRNVTATGTASTTKRTATTKSVASTTTASAVRLIAVVRSASAAGSASVTRLVRATRSASATGAASVSRFAAKSHSVAANATISAVRQVRRSAAVTASGVASVARSTQKALTGAVAASASASKAVRKTITITVTHPVTTTKGVAKSFATSVSGIASATSKIVTGTKTYEVTLEVATTAAASVSRATSATRAVVASTAASVTRVVGHRLAAAASASASLSRQARTSLVATVTGSPTVVKQTTKRFAATATNAASVIAQFISGRTTVQMTLATTTTATASVSRATSKAISVVASGSASASRAITKTVSLIASASPAAAKLMPKTFSASSTATAAAIKTTGKPLATPTTVTATTTRQPNLVLRASGSIGASVGKAVKKGLSALGGLIAAVGVTKSYGGARPVRVRGKDFAATTVAATDSHTIVTMRTAPAVTLDLTDLDVTSMKLADATSVKVTLADSPA